MFSISEIVLFSLQDVMSCVLREIRNCAFVDIGIVINMLELFLLLIFCVATHLVLLPYPALYDNACSSTLRRLRGEKRFEP